MSKGEQNLEVLEKFLSTKNGSSIRSAMIEAYKAGDESAHKIIVDRLEKVENRVENLEATILNQVEKNTAGIQSIRTLVKKTDDSVKDLTKKMTTWMNLESSTKFGAKILMGIAGIAGSIIVIFQAYKQFK